MNEPKKGDASHSESEEQFLTLADLNLFDPDPMCPICGYPMIPTDVGWGYYLCLRCGTEN